MRRDLVRETDLGAERTDDSDDNYFQGKNNAFRRAPNDFFPRSLGTFQ